MTMQLSMRSFDKISRSAEFSDCGKYRYWLRRHWNGETGATVCFIMLNPSLADCYIDDPTIRRCMGFARTWGYSTLSIRNLYAYVTPYPDILFQQENPAGTPRNDVELLAGCSAHTVVCAWGIGVKEKRLNEVRDLFQRNVPSKQLYCLGTTMHGMPKHPLYIKKTQELIPYAL